MSHAIRADYSEMHLLPPALEDWVPADHPARFIRAFVDALDVEGLGVCVRPGTEGRPHYAADLLLKVWLYGYLMRIRSTRELERACREHVSLLWLTGQHGPDHNTLWRFWRDNKGVLRGVFRRSVALALSWDMVGLVVHAIDGTKIAADVSKCRAWHRADLTRLQQELEAAIPELEQQIEVAERRPAGPYRLPDNLQDARVLQEEVRAALAQLDAAGENHLHPADPEARMMPCEGKKRFAYNAQIVVDQASGMVVAEDVVTAAADNHELTVMLDQVAVVAGATAQETVADGGYFSEEELAQADEQGYGVVVRLSENVNPADGTEPFHASRFVYDADQDVCLCPRGVTLPFKRTRIHRRGTHDLRVYQCRCYQECPNRAECCHGSRGRVIEISPYHAALVHQRHKQRDAGIRALLRQRWGIVEPVFGIIKRVLEFRRWTVRGLANIRAQWTLMVTVYNLRKLYRRWLTVGLASG